MQPVMKHSVSQGLTRDVPPTLDAATQCPHSTRRERSCRNSRNQNSHRKAGNRAQDYRRAHQRQAKRSGRWTGPTRNRQNGERANVVEMSARGSAGFLALFDLDKQCSENTSAVRRHLLTGCSLVESGCDFDGRFLDAFLREDFDAAVDVGGQCGDVLRALVAQREEVPTDRFHIGRWLPPVPASRFPRAFSRSTWRLLRPPLPFLPSALRLRVGFPWLLRCAARPHGSVLPHAALPLPCLLGRAARLVLSW